MISISNKKLKIFILLIFISQSIFCQIDPYELTDGLLKKMDEVENYSAQVLINIDVDIINIEDRTASIYYEKPDVLEIKSDGFVLMPKDGMQLNYIKLLKEDYSAIYIGEDTLHNTKAHIIKVIPLIDTSEVILAELWIDHEKNIIHRIHSFTKQNGSYTVDIFYTDHPMNLPDKIRIEFTIKGSMIPISASGDFSELSEGIKKREDSKGVVWMKYSDYKVNFEKK